MLFNEYCTDYCLVVFNSIVSSNYHLNIYTYYKLYVLEWNNSLFIYPATVVYWNKSHSRVLVKASNTQNTTNITNTTLK